MPATNHYAAVAADHFAAANLARRNAREMHEIAVNEDAQGFHDEAVASIAFRDADLALAVHHETQAALYKKLADRLSWMAA